MEHTVEKSELQAEVIKTVAFFLNTLDIEYCRSVGESMMKQAARQEAMTVFNPTHPQLKNELLRKSGKALKVLCEYTDLLKECDELRKQIKDEEGQRNKLNNLFV